MFLLKNNTLQQDDSYVVGVGASAGGLEAINEFFDNIADNGHMAFIVVQHLSSDYKSLLVELLAKHTHMPVEEARHQQQIEAGKVYVIPNNKELTVHNGLLVLKKKEAEKGPNTAIDTLFQSLAGDQRNYAIAVLLSGTGTDGTRGIAAIKSYGGFVLVQAPDTARFDGMPKSAIESGYADLVVPPAEMFSQIGNYIDGILPLETPQSRQHNEFIQSILTTVYKKTGFDFLQYKQPTILRRIARRMQVVKQDSVNGYEQFIKTNEEEPGLLAKEFFIGVTGFFRDKDAFATLYREVILRLMESKENHETLKVWVTACSTGQEAYTMAILIDMAQQQLDKLLDVKIFATDIDRTAIETAAKGKYPYNQLMGLEPKVLKEYFTEAEDGMCIIPRIRKQVVFAAHDILKDPPFIRNDLVSCRNLLIYLNPPLQENVLATLSFALNPGGFLFLGTSENPAPLRRGFVEVDDKWKIYRRTSDQHGYTRKTGAARTKASSLLPPPPKSRIDTMLADDFRKVLSDKLGYAAIYLNENYEIKEALGNFRKYLSLPDKLSTLHFLKMAPPELSGILSTVLRRCIKEHKSQEVRHIKMRAGDSQQLVDVFVYPPRETAHGGYLLVVLADSIAEAEHVPARLEETSLLHKDQYVQQLEDELRETRTNLQMAVEGLETANEELQSANEELQSANEELQSSNEELQSLNEELHTLNTEHQLRIRELVELNDDINNYLQSSLIGQIFLDQHLRIRRFNKAATAVMNIIESDIGRPIEHITHHIRSSTFSEDIHKTSRTGAVIEREIELSNGAVCLIRILPYIRQDKVRDGLVITLVDISATKNLNSLVKSVFDASSNPIFVFETVRREGQILDFTCTLANYTAYRIMEKDLHGGPLSLKKDLPELAGSSLFRKYSEVVGTGNAISAEVHFSRNGLKYWFQAGISKKQDGFVLLLSDISRRKEAEERLRKSYNELLDTKESLRELNDQLEQKIRERTRDLEVSSQQMEHTNAELQSLIQEFRFVTDFIPQMVWAVRPDGYVDFYNRQWYEYTGLDYEQSKGQGWISVLHPEDAPHTLQYWERCRLSGEPYAVEYRLRRHDGVYRWFLSRAQPMRDEKDRIIKWFGSCTDIHDQKIAEGLLEEKVQERTRELKLLNKRLEASNTDLMQFASVASHDLKEPLRKIHLFSGLLKDQFQQEVTGGAASYIDRIISASSRATNLINDVLSYSRLSSDNLFEQVNLGHVLHDILQDLELVISESKAQIYAGELPVIQAVPGQMRQLFQNIITNSLKFHKPGEAPEISITCERLTRPDSYPELKDAGGDHFEIRVKDQGIGFDEKYARKIFSLFQRLNSKEKYEGTGIGLAIANKIVERHHGVIMASGKENEGAEFIIVLPAAQPLEPRLPAEAFI